MDGIQQLSRADVGIADIVDHDIGPQAVARALGSADTPLDGPVAGAIPRRQALRQHLKRRRHEDGEPSTHMNELIFLSHSAGRTG